MHGILGLVIATIGEMGSAGDTEALAQLLELLGGDSSSASLARSDAASQARLVTALVHEACFKRGESYTAERQALTELAKPFNVDPAPMRPVTRLRRRSSTR